MNKLVILLIIVCTVTWPVRADLYSQSPNTGDWAWSNFNFTREYMSADDFTLSHDAVITRIRWYGLYSAGAPSSPNPQFAVSFLADAGGLPGSAVRSFEVSASMSDTGSIYEFTANTPSVRVDADERMWLSICNMDVTPVNGKTNWWGWTISSSIDRNHHYAYRVPGADWTGGDVDLAFALEGSVVPLPGAALLGVLGVGTAAMKLRRRLGN